MLEPETVPLKKKRVLVVNDHPVNQEFAAESCGAPGMTW